MQDSNKRKALERINELFLQAEENLGENPDLSKRYVVLARKLQARYKVRFTKEQKMCFCKRCNAYLRKGANATIRLSGKNIVLTCRECGFVRRFGYK